MTTDDIHEHQQTQHSHYHHHHLQHLPHHRHHSNNDNDDDKEEDDDRLSGACDDYEQVDSDDNSSSYASRALRRFTARAAASVHDGAIRLRNAADTDWPPHTGTAPDNHLLYPPSAAATTNIHDDITFAGKQIILR